MPDLRHTNERSTPCFAPLLQQLWIAAPAPIVIGLTMLTWAPWWSILEFSFAALVIAVAIYANRRWA